MKKHIISSSIIAATLVLTSTTAAYAHVTVKPAEVKVGQYQNFTVSVPTEKDLPTTSLKLVIPDGLQSVRPNVKPGWKIELKKQGEGEDTKVTEINWTAGSIPADQRDEFVFSAKTPTSEANLQWKAYQTYQDGSIVSWDQDPTSKDESESTGPYSLTKVINDLAVASTAPQTQTSVASNSLQTTEWIAYAALLLGVISLALQLRKAKQ
jgi:uncharacterized protein YcnI